MKLCTSLAGWERAGSFIRGLFVLAAPECGVLCQGCSAWSKAAV